MSVSTSSSPANKSDQLDFTHRYIPSMDKGDKAGLTLLLLHGTGGNEDDLLPLGHELDPNAGLLSPRGKILEGGRIPRFFRRLAEGVFDIEDLKFRTHQLAGFVTNASRIYGFDVRKVIAVGYSNGANIAASMLLLKPQTLSGAILFRAMVPLVSDNLPDLSDKRIFMSSGLRDPIATRQEAETLSGLLKQARAVVDLQWQNSGHELTQDDIHAAKQWLVLNKKQL
ncbi:MAG TPA: alpha/beta hydrolase [Nitrososphaera sp.]|nr:alpha/beta hydrolase [Nitrososphaera sp.]